MATPTPVPDPGPGAHHLLSSVLTWAGRILTPVFVLALLSKLLPPAWRCAMRWYRQWRHQWPLYVVAQHGNAKVVPVTDSSGQKSKVRVRVSVKVAPRKPSVMPPVAYLLYRLTYNNGSYHGGTCYPINELEQMVQFNDRSSTPPSPPITAPYPETFTFDIPTCGGGKPSLCSAMIVLGTECRECRAKVEPMWVLQDSG